MFCFMRSGTKSSAKAVTEAGTQPPPKMLSATNTKNVSTTTTSAAKEVAQQSKTFTPERVLMGIGAVGTGALYVSGALTEGCDAVLGDGNCAMFDAPRQLAGGLVSGLTENIKKAVLVGCLGVMLFGVLKLGKII
jgi:hypothetical protein